MKAAKKTGVTPAQAAEELLRRRAARDDLISFTNYTFDNEVQQFEVAAHHKVIADALMSVERGEVDRLMIEAPPRHTKSELASRRFPAMYLGKHPNRQIIACTYGADFAADFGRDVRDIIKQPTYKRLYPNTTLREDSKAANRWQTDQGGVFVAAGVGGPITGRGAHALLIDDPFKNREEADSASERERVWRWFQSTAYPRLMPGGAIILVMTRWHHDDLAGRILAQMEKGGEQWKVVSLPAIAVDDGKPDPLNRPAGRALWPEWYDEVALERIRKTVGPREWAALYQQTPQLDEGSFFQRDWFGRYSFDHENPAPPMNIYISSDFAVTEKKTSGDPDFTEFGVWGIDAESNLYALDWWHGQTTSDAWIDRLLQLIRQHKPLCTFGEGGVIRRSIEPFLSRAMMDQRTYCRLEWINPVRDKMASSRAFQARASMGKVFFPWEAWADRVVDQLVAFPTAAHDDAVDVCAKIGLALDQMHPAIAPVVADEPKKIDGWAKAFAELDNSQPTWRVM